MQALSTILHYTVTCPWLGGRVTLTVSKKDDGVSARLLFRGQLVLVSTLVTVFGFILTSPGTLATGIFSSQFLNTRCHRRADTSTATAVRTFLALLP